MAIYCSSGFIITGEELPSGKLATLKVCEGGNSIIITNPYAGDQYGGQVVFDKSHMDDLIKVLNLMKGELTARETKT